MTRPRIIIPPAEVAILLHHRRVNHYSTKTLSEVMGYCDRVIRRCLREHGLNKTVRTYDVVWPEEDTARAQQYIADGMTQREVARLLGRSYFAVVKKMYRQRKLDPLYAQQLSRSRHVTHILPTTSDSSPLQRESVIARKQGEVHV